MLAETQRLALLRAMGIDVFRLRAADPPAAVPAAAAQATNVAVICGRDAVPARFKTQLPRALGIAQERLLWLDPGAAVPAAAAAYVVVGTEAARALGVQLSTMQQNTCVIAATAEAAELLHGAAAKRALWQVLKPVARRVRGH